MTRVLIAAFLSTALTSGAALAGEAKTEQVPLVGYTRTGEMSNCIYARRLDQVKILNSTQILFEMHGGDFYLNEPTSCPSLRKRYALKYDSTIGQICTTTIVTLLDTGSGIHYQGTCGLGKFEKVEKIVAEK
jgi:hypothetical protein